MKKVTLIVTLLCLSGISYANCGNGGDNGNGCSGGNTGSQGPQGPQGPAGKDGLNGTNGSNGNNGVNGAVGPVSPQKSVLLTSFKLRLFDAYYMSMYVFDNYQLDPRQDHDLFKTAQNSSYGVEFVIKLGSSYEERQIEKLRNELKGHNVIELPE